MVTVLSSVEHAVTEACDLKKKSCLQHDRSPHKIIDRGGLKFRLIYLWHSIVNKVFLLMCLILLCSKGLGCGEFIVDA